MFTVEMLYFALFFSLSPFVYVLLTKQDPQKVVRAIVDNITIARPDFNNFVGNGTTFIM